MTSRNEGRKIAARSAISAPLMPPGPMSITVPRYAEKVNNGPGMACDAP